MEPEIGHFRLSVYKYIIKLIRHHRKKNIEQKLHTNFTRSPAFLSASTAVACVTSTTDVSLTETMISLTFVRPSAYAAPPGITFGGLIKKENLF